jgi:hypothetical protein
VLGAECYERSDGRRGHRNGYRPGLLTTQKDSGLIHSIVSTAANVHDLTPAANLLHGGEHAVYADGGYHGIAKKPEMTGKTTEFRVASDPANAGIYQMHQLESCRI